MDFQNEDERAVYLAAFAEYATSDSIDPLARASIAVRAFRAAHPNGLPKTPTPDDHYCCACGSNQNQWSVRADARKNALAEFLEQLSEEATGLHGDGFTNGAAAVRSVAAALKSRLK